MIRKSLAVFLAALLILSSGSLAAGESFPFIAFADTAVNLRSGPGVSSAILKVIPSGDPMIVNGESDGYYIVSYEGSQGYVAKEYIKTGSADGTRTPENYETLMASSSGSKVRVLQQALKELGYYTSGIDGKYGKGTAGAVAAFQNANGLSGSGEADPDTQRTLYENTVVDAKGKRAFVSVVAPVDYPYMAKGKKGDEVIKLQNRLAELGYYSGKADGDFGAGTANAVKEYQKMNALAETGEADSITLRNMFSDKAVAKGGATKAPAAAPTAVPTSAPIGGGPSLPFETTTKTSVNLRKGKGVSTARILTIPRNAMILVLALEGNYLKVSYSGRTGYVVAEYIHVPEEYYQYGIGEDSGKYPTLSPGSGGSQVAALQNALKELFYYALNSDGSYGNRTEAAVRAFQANNGMIQTGIADGVMQTLLYDGNPRDAFGRQKEVNTLPEVSGVTLRLNSTGDAVTVLQMRLKALGFYTGDCGLTFDKATEQAVKNFQKVYGLTADGVVGPKTQDKLNEAAIPQATATPEPVQIPVVPIPETTPITSDNVVTLRSGMRGTQVVSVERRLRELGYYAEEANGVYTDRVIAAVKAFQSANGLTADGIAGLKTQVLLFSDRAKPYTEPTPSPEPIVTPEVLNKLQSGSKGEAVSALQSRLIALGYLTGEIDGIYGKATENAVKAFQKVNGLTADGIAGLATLQLIYTSQAKVKPTPTPSPTPKPTATPKPTNVPTQVPAPEPTAAPKVTNTPKTSYTIAPRATATPINTKTIVVTPTPNTKSIIQKGDKGSAVEALQKRLSELGYLKGWDGIFGTQTYNAVVAFQKRNSLSSDGVAGPKTLTRLYSSSALSVSGASATATPKPTATPQPIVTQSPYDGFTVPSLGQVINANWYTDIRDRAKSMPNAVIYDPDTGLHYNLHMFSFGKHADCETPTAQDTAIMNQICGINNWTPKAVWVIFSDGSVYLGSTHSHGHEVDHTPGNDLTGHVCLHFPRVMSEAEATGPYAVSHQNAIIAEWSRIQGLLH